MTADHAPQAHNEGAATGLGTASKSGPISAASGAARSYIRRNPMTAAFLAAILAGLFILGRLVPGPAADHFKLAISTNPHNLAHDPVLVLLASPLVAATDSGWLSHLAVIGGGVGICLAALERRFGAVRAAAVFLVGNTVATAVATSVAAAAIHSGRYPAQWWSGYDYGISYGVLTVAAAVTPLVAARWRIAWAALVFAYPFLDAQWFGALPNFVTIGHLTGAAFGLASGWTLARRA